MTQQQQQSRRRNPVLATVGPAARPGVAAGRGVADRAADPINHILGHDRVAPSIRGGRPAPHGPGPTHRPPRPPPILQSHDLEVGRLPFSEDEVLPAF